MPKILQCDIIPSTFHISKVSKVANLVYSSIVGSDNVVFFVAKLFKIFVLFYLKNSFSLQ